MSELQRALEAALGIQIERDNDGNVTNVIPDDDDQGQERQLHPTGYCCSPPRHGVG